MKSLLLLIAFWIGTSHAFIAVAPKRWTLTNRRETTTTLSASTPSVTTPSTSARGKDDDEKNLHRREALKHMLVLVVTSSLCLPPLLGQQKAMAAETDETMYAPKFVQQYADFIETPEGWSYREVTPGKNDRNIKASLGDRVVFDWSGYTIGYFGRPFQAKGGP